MHALSIKEGLSARTLAKLTGRLRKHFKREGFRSLKPPLLLPKISGCDHLTGHRVLYEFGAGLDVQVVHHRVFMKGHRSR